MFKWLGQPLGKKKQETKQQPEQPLGKKKQETKKRSEQLSEKREQKTRQLWEREFNIVKEGLDEGQVIAFVNDLFADQKASQEATTASLRSLLETTVTDAGEIAASIKMKARTEAEAEAARIIDQAKQEAEEIKRKTEIASQKEVEDIISMANRKAQITEVETKQKALLFLLRAREEIEKEIREEYKRACSRLSSSLQNLMSEGQSIETELKGKRARLWESKDLELKEFETPLLRTSGMAAPSTKTPAPTEVEVEPDIASEEKIEQPAQLQEETPEEKIEQLAQLQEETIVSEPVEAVTEELLEQHPPEERPSIEETVSARPGQDSQTLYAGEVELSIGTPVDLNAVSKLYNHLQTIPELRIVRTRGSWDQGTTITVALEKPMPLISIISKTPDVEVTPELLQNDSSVQETSSSPLRTKRKEVKGIKLALKEAKTR